MITAMTSFIIQISLPQSTFATVLDWTQLPTTRPCFDAWSSFLGGGVKIFVLPSHRIYLSFKGKLLLSPKRKSIMKCCRRYGQKLDYWPDISHRVSLSINITAHYHLPGDNQAYQFFFNVSGFTNDPVQARITHYGSCYCMLDVN